MKFEKMKIISEDKSVNQQAVGSDSDWPERGIESFKL